MVTLSDDLRSKLCSATLSEKIDNLKCILYFGHIFRSIRWYVWSMHYLDDIGRENRWCEKHTLLSLVTLSEEIDARSKHYFGHLVRRNGWSEMQSLVTSSLEPDELRSNHYFGHIVKRNRSEKQWLLWSHCQKKYIHDLRRNH